MQRPWPAEPGNGSLQVLAVIPGDGAQSGKLPSLISTSDSNSSGERVPKDVEPVKKRPHRIRPGPPCPSGEGSAGCGPKTSSRPIHSEPPASAAPRSRDPTASSPVSSIVTLQVCLPPDETRRPLQPAMREVIQSQTSLRSHPQISPKNHDMDCLTQTPLGGSRSETYELTLG